MKEVTIATRSEGLVTFEVIAFVDPRSIEEAGATEELFLEEVRCIYAAEILRSLVKGSLGEFFSTSDNSEPDDGNKPEPPIHEVRDETIRSLLDKGVAVEVRRIEDGAVRVVSRLTITSTSVIEEPMTEVGG